MLKKTKKGCWILEKFAQQDGLIHGFSTRKFGNMSVKKSLSKNKNLKRFLSLFGAKTNNLVMMGQIHGKEIKVVDEEDEGKVLPGVDGMVSSQNGIILGAKVADCLPILFYDKKRKIIGIAHAGWKGTLEKIGQSMFKKMRLFGSNPKNILVGIGPHIGSCCYLISKKRADKFEKEFGNLQGMIFEDSRGIHLDLIAPTVVQLIKAGIWGDNVEAALECTSCQNSEFFSFRKNKGKDFGEMLGFIGLRTIPERSRK